MARYLLQVQAADISFNSDTSGHALACAQAIAQALQLPVILQATGDATTRQSVAAAAVGSASNVGLGISAG
jgi:hypothetical protein